MDRVVLRRRGAFVPLDRPLQIAGYGFAFRGTIAIGYLIQGRPALVLMSAVAIAIAAMNAYPHTILTADRDGISAPTGHRQARLAWERISLLAVFPPHDGTVTVEIRARPDDDPPIRPWARTSGSPWARIGESLQRLQPVPRLRRPRHGTPFAFMLEIRCTERSASELADRLQRLAPVPVARPAADPVDPYQVRARRRSVLPTAAVFLAWNSVIGTIWATAIARQYPRAVLPIALISIGAGLAVGGVQGFAPATFVSGLRTVGDPFAFGVPTPLDGEITLGAVVLEVTGGRTMALRRLTEWP